MRLPSPDADLEALLGTVNRALAGIRGQAAAYARHEAELKAQVEHVSHDLRTPLDVHPRGTWRSWTTRPSTPTRAQALGTVRRKAASLERLVARFYELSRLQGEDAPLELGPVDVGRMLRESVAEQYRLLADRGLDVRLRRAGARRHGVRERRGGGARAGEPAAQRRQVREDGAGGVGGGRGSLRGPAAAWSSCSPTTPTPSARTRWRACSSRSSWRMHRALAGGLGPRPGHRPPPAGAHGRRHRGAPRETGTARRGSCSASRCPPRDDFFLQIVCLGELFRANGPVSRYYVPEK